MSDNAFLEYRFSKWSYLLSESAEHAHKLLVFAHRESDENRSLQGASVGAQKVERRYVSPRWEVDQFLKAFAVVAEEDDHYRQLLSNVCNTDVYCGYGLHAPTYHELATSLGEAVVDRLEAACDTMTLWPHPQQPPEITIPGLKQLLDKVEIEVDRQDETPNNAVAAIRGALREIPLDNLEKVLTGIESERRKIQSKSTQADSTGKTSSERTNETSSNREAYLSTAQLAERFDVDRSALEQRLMRWRKKNAASPDFQEVDVRGVRQPKCLYKVAAVEHILLALRDKTMNERGTNKK